MKAPGAFPGLLPVALALLFLGAVALHAGALLAPFFADDFLFLDQTRGRSLASALASPDPLGNYFRPVSRQLWFWLLGHGAGESPVAFHAANLALFLVILALLFRIARRLLPTRVALAATAVVAVHHAVDVPLWWASGSQDLLAVAAALAAIELCALGRFGWAALPMGVALLSKETVLFTPLISALYVRRHGEHLLFAARRVWPLFAAALAWLGLWMTTTARRPTLGLEVAMDPAGIPAALLHLLQTAIGIEWPESDPLSALRSPPAWPALVVAAGVALLAWRDRALDDGRRPRSEAARRHALETGAAWALLGAVPVIAVAQIWSAYYYLFALCGVTLVLGALIPRRPAWVAAIPVLLVAWTSQNARSIPEFATARGSWTTQSHLNRHYLRRGMVLAMRCLAELRKARPELPSGSTLYFAGLPSAIAFQAADGPLVRWAYKDSTLRSYFLTSFDLDRALSGPTFFFQMTRDTLTEVQGPDSLERLGFGMILNDVPQAARDLLALAWRSSGGHPKLAYQLAWTEAARGDMDAAAVWLRAADVGLGVGPAPEVPAALDRVVAGDTAGAIALVQVALQRDGLDAGAHALLADLMLASGQLLPGTLEAYAARALAPGVPSMWRRWGLVEAAHRRDAQAAAALNRYLELGGDEAQADAEVRELLAGLRRRLPGGAEAQAALRGIRETRREPPGGS